MAIRLPPWLSFGLHWLPFAWLWFHLINHLRVEWTLNPQYSYGWAVPFLCAYLLWLRLRCERNPAPTLARSPSSDRPPPSAPHLPVIVYCLGLLAFLYFPTRLIEEANPEWRLVSWTLVGLAIGISLCAWRLVTGDWGRRTVLFPIGYFLVAVPWPTFVEAPLIRILTRANIAITIELLNIIGIPAIQHGNVIEIATGFVGVDEACSGIRSFQATLMISLFLGELYRLSVRRRLALVFSGFALSFVFNIGRAGLLTWVAARDGVPAISKWHDPAGVIILLGCFTGLWAISALLRRPLQPANSPPCAGVPSPVGHCVHASVRLAVFLTFWLLIVEIGVEWWYRSHETRAPAPVVWSVTWPTNNHTLKHIPIPETTRRILRYDECENLEWQDDQHIWQGIFLRWQPGRTAVHLARNHTPDICLPAAGRQLLSTSDIKWFPVHGLQMPFRVYSLADTVGTSYVFYCLWEDRAEDRSFQSVSLKYGGRLAPVLAGRRQGGQRSLEVILRGVADETTAIASFQTLLGTLIRVVPENQTP